MILLPMTPEVFARMLLEHYAATKVVRFHRESVTALGATDLDAQFLCDVGFPAWVAPHMHFESGANGVLMAPACGESGELIDGLPSGLGMLGWTGEGWPICLWSEHPREIWCIRHGETPTMQRMNTSVVALAGFLDSLRDVVEQVLAWGVARGVEGAWNRGVPPSFVKGLRARFRALDGRAMKGAGYWRDYVRSIATR